VKFDLFFQIFANNFCVLYRIFVNFLLKFDFCRWLWQPLLFKQSQIFPLLIANTDFPRPSASTSTTEKTLIPLRSPLEPTNSTRYVYTVRIRITYTLNGRVSPNGETKRNRALKRYIRIRITYTLNRGKVEEARLSTYIRIR